MWLYIFIFSLYEKVIWAKTSEVGLFQEENSPQWKGNPCLIKVILNLKNRWKM